MALFKHIATSQVRMKYLNVLLGHIFIDENCRGKPTLSFKLYKNGHLHESLSTPFCLNEMFSLDTPSECSHCIAKVTHVCTKLDLTDDIRVWESPSALWRTWQNKHFVQYNLMWQTILNHHNNGENVYKQIDRLSNKLQQKFKKSKSLSTQLYEYTQLYLTCV